MQRIQSFQIDHDLLDPGIYVSRVDGDITTYDLRTRKPNAGDYMDTITMHSVEHMIATFIRNSAIADQVIYFGPMGCQTGFYLLIRNADNNVVLSTLKSMLQQVLDHDGPVFGASQKECGNYRNLDIDCAKRECRRYLDCLNAKTSHDFTYAQ